MQKIFQFFRQACINSYELINYLNIDEVLKSFCGNYSFRKYLPKKSGRNGMKIQTCFNSKLPYTYNLEVYTGMELPDSYKVSNRPKDAVLRLIEPLANHP